MSVKLKILRKSIFVFHFGCAACNNCDIEILDCLTPKFDLERFGIQLVGSIRHADALLVTGMLNKKGLPRLKRVYEQMPEPKVVIAFGACAASGGIFRDGSDRTVSRNSCRPDVAQHRISRHRRALPGSEPRLSAPKQSETDFSNGPPVFSGGVA